MGIQSMERSYLAVHMALTFALLVNANCSSSGKSLPRYEDNPTELARLAQEAEDRCADRGFPAGNPTVPFFTDGCTGWSDKVIHQCCLEHDMDYWCGGSREDRRQADNRLRKCAENTYGEESGPFLGWMIEAGATAGGSPHMRTSWRWGYGHEYAESSYTNDKTPHEP